jgi:hypothetical protein
MEFTQEQKLYAEIVQKAWEDAEFKRIDDKSGRSY